jgi:hypothetical protein
MLSTILIVVLILLLIGALPTWPYSSGWGYYPGGAATSLCYLPVLPASEFSNATSARADRTRNCSARHCR